MRHPTSSIQPLYRRDRETRSHTSHYSYWLDTPASFHSTAGSIHLGARSHLRGEGNIIFSGIFVTFQILPNSLGNSVLYMGIPLLQDLKNRSKPRRLTLRKLGELQYKKYRQQKASAGNWVFHLT